MLFKISFDTILRLTVYNKRVNSDTDNRASNAEIIGKPPMTVSLKKANAEDATQLPKSPR